MSEVSLPRYNIISITKKGEKPLPIKNPQKSFSFGTDPSCQIRLKDVEGAGFAAVHCQVTPIEGKMFLVCNAATSVNGQLTKGIPVALNNGDRISIGSKGVHVNFRYEVTKPAESAVPFQDITQQVVVQDTPIKVEKSTEGELAHSSSSLFETANGSQDRSRHDEDSAEDKENNPSSVAKERRPTPEVARPETEREEAPKSDVGPKSTPAKPLSRKLTYSDAMVPPPQAKKTTKKSSSSELAVDDELKNYADEEIQQVSLSSAREEVEEESIEEKKVAKTPKKQTKTPKKNTKATKKTEEKEEDSAVESKAEEEEAEKPVKETKSAKTPKKNTKAKKTEEKEDSEVESKAEEEEPVKETKAAKTPKKQAKNKKVEEKPAEVEASEDNEVSEAAEESTKGKRKAAKTPKKQTKGKKAEEKPVEEREASEAESQVEEPVKETKAKKGTKTPKKNTKAKKEAEKVEESEPEEVSEAESKVEEEPVKETKAKKGAKTPKKNTKARKEAKKEESEPEKESEAEEESVKETKKTPKKAAAKGKKATKAVEKSESEKEESEAEPSEQEKPVPEFKTPTKKSSKTPGKAYIANATYDSPKSPTKSPRPLSISPSKRYQKVANIDGAVKHEVYCRWVPKNFDISKDNTQPRQLRNSPERKHTNFLAQKVYPGTTVKSTKKSKKNKKQASAPNSPTKTVKTPAQSVKKETKIKIKVDTHKSKHAGRVVEHFDAPDERSRMEILSMSLVNMVKEQLALMNSWVLFDEIYVYHRAHYGVLNMDALRDIVKELVNEEVVSMSTKSKIKRYCLAGSELEEPVKEKKEKVVEELPENETDDEESEDEGDLRTDLQQQLMQIWSRVKVANSDKFPQAVLPFMHRPSKSKYPEYYASVSRVVTMKMILQSIKAGDYESLEDMAKDFRQMFVNFKRFNRPKSDVYRCGALLEKTYKAAMKDAKEAANEKHEEEGSEHESEEKSESEEREQSSDRESDNEDQEEKSERDEESENGSDNEEAKSGSDNEDEAQESVKESVESDDE